MSYLHNGIKNLWQWVPVTDSLLTDDWQRKLADYQILLVGFSGGLDSTVLLHRVASEPALASKLQAVHVHHGLSVNATDWQMHCQKFCDSLNLPLIVRHVTVDREANIEEGARIARYQAFSSLLEERSLLLLAHHCDDQAETLLLQLLRGAGIDGLASMPAVKTCAQGEIARPFLHHSRSTLEAYAHKHQLTWVDDESNQNSAFSRNYLRHHIMPLLQAKWPGVVGNLVRSASHCQQAKSNLEALAKMDCAALAETRSTLELSSPLRTLDHSRLANILRLWLQDNDVRLPSVHNLNRLMDEVILAGEDRTPLVQWGGVTVRRYQQTLYLLKDDVRPCVARMEWLSFPHPLPLTTDAGEQYLHAVADVQGLHVPVGSRVSVRFRQGGEQFYWRGQTKQLKKLWQQWRVPPWQRGLIPLLYIDNALAAVVGFAISDHFFSERPLNTFRVELQSCAVSRIMD